MKGGDELTMKVTEALAVLKKTLAATPATKVEQRQVKVEETPVATSAPALAPTPAPVSTSVSAATTEAEAEELGYWSELTPLQKRAATQLGWSQQTSSPHSTPPGCDALPVSVGELPRVQPNRIKTEADRAAGRVEYKRLVSPRNGTLHLLMVGALSR